MAHSWPFGIVGSKVVDNTVLFFGPLFTETHGRISGKDDDAYDSWRRRGTLEVADCDIGTKNQDPEGRTRILGIFHSSFGPSSQCLARNASEWVNVLTFEESST